MNSKWRIAASIIVLTISACDDDGNCDQYHDGTFTTNQIFQQQNLVETKDGIQTELNEETGHAFQSNINWINDCEYQLGNFQERKDWSDSFHPWLAGRIVRARIIKSNKAYCIYEAEMSDVSMIIRDTLWMVD